MLTASAILPRKIVEKPWGREQLGEPFADIAGDRIGEIWFEPPPQLDDLLVKYLFTEEKLSVQVHPDDDQAPAGERGKTECWYILDAAPGARIAMGLKEQLSAERLRAAALDGSIEDALNWFEVRAGDFIFIPAGTIHAIGAGLTILEIQQNSDITYRLYDYGRPRELHLDEAMRVALREPFDPALIKHVDPSGTHTLCRNPAFDVTLVRGAPGTELLRDQHGPALLAVLRGSITTPDGVAEKGHCAFVEDVAEVNWSADAETALITRGK